MAKRMSLWCPLCDELVAGFGRRQTIGRIAEHLATKHRELTEAQQDELSRRPWMPLPLAEVPTAAAYGPSGIGGTSRR